MIANWPANFLALVDKITFMIIQPPFIYFIGIVVLLVVIGFFKEVIS